MVRRSLLDEMWVPTPDAAPAAPAPSPSPSPPPSKEFDWRWWMPMGILIVILVSPFFYWGWRLWNKKNKKPIPVTQNDRTLDKSGINIALKRVCHPSALTMFDEIISASQGKQILMFLDYDGTLSPIVEDPDRAFMSIEMREAVSDASEYFPTAIVSGRSRTKVYDFVRLSQLYYAGSHGMDIQGPAQGSQRIMCQPAIEFLPLIDEIYNILVEKTKTTPGAFVENNKFCVSVHFRRVDEKNWSYLEEQVKTVLNNYPNLRTSNGRKVLEIRPTIKWDKGNAVEFLLKSLGYENSKNVYPIYIGDDRTDEDAFKVLRKRKQGLRILVSNIPKETDASYSLQDPPEVMHFLRRLVEWKRERERKGKFSCCSS